MPLVSVEIPVLENILSLTPEKFSLSKTLTGHDEPVICLAIHPKDDILLSGGKHTH